MAMAANLTYEQAFEHFKSAGLATARKRKPPCATTFSELRYVLKQAGVATRMRPFKSAKDLPARAILKVNVRANGDWHWVFAERANEKVLCVFDPARSGPSYTPVWLGTDRTSLGDYWTPKGYYLEILPSLPETLNEDSCAFRHSP